jgi:WD40 repeat protein
MACVAGFALLLGLAACNGPREPDPEPGLGPLVASEPLVCVGHTKSVNSVVVSPDGKLVVSGSDDQTLRFWNTKDGKLIRTIDVPEVREESKYVEALTFSPDGKTFVACRSGRTLLFFDAATGEAAPERCPVRQGGFGAAFSPDGKRLAVAGRGGVWVWSVATGDKLFEFLIPQLPEEGGVGQAHRVAFTPDGKHLAATIRAEGLKGRKSAEPPLRVWDLATRECVFSRGDVDSGSLAFSPNGRLLAVDAPQDGVDVYDWRKNKRRASFEVNSRSVSRLVFAPDGKAIFTGGNDLGVRRWELPNGEPAGVLEGPTGAVSALSLSRNGKVVASADKEKRVLIWHLGAE